MLEKYPLVTKAEALVLFKFLNGDIQKIAEILDLEEETVRQWYKEYRDEKKTLTPV